MAYNYVEIHEQDIIDAAEMTADVTSVAVPINNRQINRSIREYTVHVKWDSGASPVGRIYIQATNFDPTVESDWIEVNGTSFNITGNSGNGAWNICSHNYKFMRVKYSFTSGSATLYARFNGKGDKI